MERLVEALSSPACGPDFPVTKTLKACRPPTRRQNNDDGGRTWGIRPTWKERRS